MKNIVVMWLSLTRNVRKGLKLLIFFL